MSDKLIINPQPLNPFKPAAPKTQETTVVDGQAFGKVFEDALTRQNELKFSAHALERLRQRKFDLDKEDLGKISEAVEQARRKGVKSSLVMLGDLALVASVKNSTIITAVDTKNMKDHVFTGIDGAVIIE